MRLFVLSAALAFAPLAALAQASATDPVAAAVGVYHSTMTGQDILVPAGPVQVTVTRVTLPAGGVLPAHKHPFARYAYVLSGAIRVTNLDTGQVTALKAGAFAIESRDQWHRAETVGEGPAVLLVIDQTPPGQGNLVRQAP